jgi:hypothetical protein
MARGTSSRDKISYERLRKKYHPEMKDKEKETIKKEILEKGVDMADNIIEKEIGTPEKAKAKEEFFSRIVKGEEQGKNSAHLRETNRLVNNCLKDWNNEYPRKKLHKYIMSGVGENLTDPTDDIMFLNFRWGTSNGKDKENLFMLIKMFEFMEKIGSYTAEKLGLGKK